MRPEQIATGMAFIIGLLILAGYGLILLVQHAMGL